MCSTVQCMRVGGEGCMCTVYEGWGGCMCTVQCMRVGGGCMCTVSLLLCNSITVRVLTADLNMQVAYPQLCIESQLFLYSV